MIDINTDNMEVVDRLCKTAITLGALYVGYDVVRRLIDLVIKKVLGEEVNIQPGSLHVVLHCSTDERFLEVLTDYESGKMKERLEEEFSKVGIKVKGLKVEIQNMADVNEIKEAMYRRNLYEGVKNVAKDDAESNTKKNTVRIKKIFENSYAVDRIYQGHLFKKSLDSCMEQNFFYCYSYMLF